MKAAQGATARATAPRPPVDGPVDGPDDGVAGGWRRRLIVAVLGVAILAGIALRFWTRSHLWFDEALSVEIARLPLGDIPDALRRDGHPPLYYFLLHGWMEVFGSGDVAVRALSGVFSVATLPLAWLAGRRLGGRRVGWIAMFVTASSPFAIRYATEARMYALVMFLVLAGYLVLRRALADPSIGVLALVTTITAALTLTQYWNLYLLAVVGAALLWRSLRASEPADRRRARRVLVAMAVGAALFLTWIGVFLHQLAHTGTPWGNPQFPWVAMPRTLIALAGSDEDGEAFVLAFFLLVLPILAVFGRGIDRRRIELDLHTRTAVRWEAGAAMGALLLGAGLSYVGGTTFEPRYGATFAPLMLLVTAFGITVFVSPRVRIVMLVFVVALGLAGGLRNGTTERTQAGQVASVIVANARPGDVVAYCPDQVGPAVSRLLRDEPGLVQMTFPHGARPETIDWTDYLENVRSVPPAEFAGKVLDRAGDATIWYVSAPGLNHFGQICQVVAAEFLAKRPSTPRVFPDDSIFEFDGLTEFPGP